MSMGWEGTGSFGGWRSECAMDFTICRGRRRSRLVAFRLLFSFFLFRDKFTFPCEICYRYFMLSLECWLDGSFTGSFMEWEDIYLIDEDFSMYEQEYYIFLFSVPSSRKGLSSIKLFLAYHTLRQINSWRFFKRALILGMRHGMYLARCF